MDRVIAKQIVDAAMSFCEQTETVSEAVLLIDDEVLRKKLISSLARVMDEIYIGVISQVVIDYPELDPLFAERQARTGAG